jgi:hypothetical protein
MTGSIAVLVVGILLLLASLSADLTGLGDDVGFGRQQTIGSVVGAVVTVVGVFLMTRAKKQS